MSKRTKEVPKLGDATYVHTLVIESMGTMGPMDLVFIHTFCRQTMKIHCIGKFTKLFDCLGHCFVIFMSKC